MISEEMLHRERIFVLAEHVHYIQKKTKISDVFCVGGCVRDLLLGIKVHPTDIDVTCAGDPQHIWEKTDTTDMSAFITEKFGTMTFIPKDTEVPTEKKKNRFEKVQYELTPLRAEAGYTDKRHPDVVTRSDSLVQDAKRRDFTINAMYYTTVGLASGASKVPVDKMPSREVIQKTLQEKGRFVDAESHICIIQHTDIIESFWPKCIFASKVFLQRLQDDFGITQESFHCIVDPCGGITDMLAGKLAAVGVADMRIAEDSLRIIRAVRFVNVLNTALLQHNKITQTLFFDFAKDTRNSLRKNFHLVKGLPKERIKIELDKVFQNGSPFGFLSVCDELNILKVLLPSLYATKHVWQPVRYHPFDVFVHTLLTVYHCEKLTKNYLIRRAMVLHDVGKVDQYHLYSLGLGKDDIHEIGALNHRNSSGKIAAKDLEALGFSNKEIEEICRYIDHHHKPEEILAAREDNRKKKLRKLYSEAGYERLCNLFVLVQADRMGQYNPIQGTNLSEIVYLQHMLDELKETEGQFTMKELAIDGNELMKIFSLEPGPHIGELLAKAFAWVLDDIASKNTKTRITNYLKQSMGI